ncbi:restriction endonuclease [Streptomyces sp. 150FB]|uniref:Uma2 family endonuclease n=1 Tax=Streptomyces sp. 150FB TaxID=1576605 RepID=UPI0005895CBB|nr:Uma2 family endonuclease [Streptomyces sp. 150FB]KIF76379.1 restriction endonuclease [Streptomyces sp. 150FB]
MNTNAVDPDDSLGQGWDELVRIWEGTDAPEGCKVEIIEGIVTVASLPSKNHSLTAALLQRRLYGVIPEDCGVFQRLGLSAPGRQGLFVPDVAVLPRTAVTGPGYHVPADEALLVVEITSQSNANHDRIKKLHGYAGAGVPLYLLLDPWRSGRPTATLYGEPAGGTYRILDSIEYGEKLTLPAPFDLPIGTAEFPVN